MSVLTSQALVKSREIIGQSIMPTYFSEQYPVDWTQIPIYRFADLGNEPGVLTDKKQMTYSSPKPNDQIGQNAEDYARQVTAFNPMFRRQTLMYMGFAQDIEALRIFTIY